MMDDVHFLSYNYIIRHLGRWIGWMFLHLMSEEGPISETYYNVSISKTVDNVLHINFSNPMLV
jgi:hypothetical protein